MATEATVDELRDRMARLEDERAIAAKQRRVTAPMPQSAPPQPQPVETASPPTVTPRPRRPSPQPQPQPVPTQTTAPLLPADEQPMWNANIAFNTPEQINLDEHRVIRMLLDLHLTAKQLEQQLQRRQ